MRPIAFYRVRTDGIDPQFSIAARKKGDLYLPFYVHHSHTAEDPQDPGLKHLKMLIAQAPDSTVMPNEIFIDRLGLRSKRKPIPADKIPDLWTLEGVALASERFLDCLGSDVAQLGIVRPIELYDFANDQRFPGEHYTFICRRVAKIDPIEGEFQDDLSDNPFMTPKEKSWLRTAIYDEGILSFLGSVPLFVFFNKPETFFLSHGLMQKIESRRLTGFTEKKTKFSRGDVSHVWARS